MSTRVEKWRSVAEAIVKPHLVDVCLALIHVESAGDEHARRPRSQFCGLLQMGRMAGMDVGLEDRGRATTEVLLGDGDLAIEYWDRYVERYRARHADDPERIAILWKGGPGYLSTVNSAIDIGIDAAVTLAAERHGFSASEYLHRFRLAWDIYHDATPCPTCGGRGTV